MKQFPTHIVAASGLVFNEKEEVLLIKNHKGEWTWTGGQVETGENVLEAVLREIKEESGVDAIVGSLFAICSNTSSYPGFNGYETVPTKVMFDFICHYTGGSLIQHTDETCAAKWVRKEEVLEYITSPNLVARYNAYLTYQGQVHYLSYVTKPEFIIQIKQLL